jgi:DNA invertase Pin-like site-specific DNA recombinase
VRDDYTVALYIRLSAEDENEGESDSVKNQRDLLTAFVKRDAGFSGCTLLEFCDDGYSGVNFNRPNVKAMLDRVRKGEINCVVVKDFSRFGRNYIEVGDYIEQVFPFLGVRFISVNDHYDSDKDYNSIGGIEVALRALIYDLYSKDLSQKVKSALAVRYKKGEYVSSYSPFGYVKAEDGNRLVVDETAAKYVRRMFALAISGKAAFEIAQILNAEMTPTKAQYKKHEMGYATWDKRTIDIDNSFWSDKSVRKVIQNDVYIGTVVSGKTERQTFGDKKFRQKPRSEWICVPDMHEPIVSKEDFELANKLLVMPRRKKNAPKERYLYAKVRCHCCKRSLLRLRSKSPEYACETPRFKPSPNCVTEPVSELKIEEALLLAIRAQAASVIDMDKARAKKNGQITERKLELQKILRRLDGMVNNLTTARQEQYERYADGNIGLDEFTAQKASFNEQIEGHIAKIEEVKSLIDGCDALITDMAHVTEEWRNALNIECLSKELVDALVDSITVYDSEHIEIRWRFADEYALSEGETGNVG